MHAKRIHTISLFLGAVGCAICFSDTVHHDLVLEQSADLQEWTVVPISPGMITDAGALRVPGNVSPMFYRLDYTLNPAPETVLYFENFESGAGGWTSGAISGTDQWQFGTPAQTLINAARSGSNAWMTRLDANYDNSVNCWLMTPLIDFTMVGEPLYFSVWLNIDCESNYDGMIMEYSTDFGFSWTYLDSVDYNRSGGGSGALAMPHWSGQLGGEWMEYSGQLPGNSFWGLAVHFRFRFLSDSSANFEGIALDDFRIWTSPE